MSEAQPKKLTSKRDRQRARDMRDEQWEFMRRVNGLGTLWVCWWNKNRRHDLEKLPPDLWVMCLISGCEMSEWMNRHPDWWVIGEWDDTRYAAPVSLTDAGRAALANKDAYDMEPVTGGMVEPGWQCVPLPPKPSIQKAA